ncbi:HAMP domain-containing histidine kinase [Changchengzhania lutea]|uniref:HAMP domain-containing histidine kinase n=1 Tax=Changchengzhania lutea TaxID=2049305 RepID=UPI00115E4D21|nr:HAMP domain-containing histidine kinase [Changchengzhania lutea]
MYKTFHRNKDALGIGLFITRNHIEPFGGKIKVKSEFDVGTTFSVYFRKPTTFILEETF